MEHTKENELLHLEDIKQKLSKEIDEINTQLGDKQNEIVQMKKYFWENISEFDEFGYEQYTNRQMIQSEIDMAADRMKKRQKYEKLLQSPYFACVDFCYDGEEKAQSFYIGTSSFSMKKAFVPLIFDWRAPISGLFYDYDKGKAQFESPQGTVTGTIVHKLQYKIAKGEMEYFFENDMKIDDDILMHELGNNANARLKSIVATIQKEQNAIIRNNKDKILVVQGAAGSGKTSIALHRIAYLLYHRRQELNSDNVMILTPNPIFSDYISQILPELGEDRIVEMSFDEYAEKELSGLIRMETAAKQKESLLTADPKDAEYQKRLWQISYKQSQEFLEEMMGFVLNLEEDLVEWRALNYRGVKRSEEELEKLFYEKFPETPILKRLSLISDYIVSDIESIEGKDMDPFRSQLLKERMNSMYRTTDIRRIYYEFLLFLEEQGKGELLPDWQPLDCWETRKIFISKEEEEDSFLDGNLPYEGKGLTSGTTNGQNKAQSPEETRPFVRYEDVFPMLYLQLLLCGVQKHRSIKHLVIDEMQDYSRVQYALICQLFTCPMTILGDREQVSDGQKSEVLTLLPQIFGKGIRVLEMKKSYRSTYEIGKFASQFIDCTDTEYFDRHGREPRLHSCQGYDDSLIKMLEEIKEQQEKFDTIAILCQTQAKAQSVYDKLKKKIKLSLFTEDSDKFQSGIVVSSYFLAKGLEFDAVHVVDVSKKSYYSPMHRQILYIASTRALHELDLYYSKEKSELVLSL